MVVRADGSGRWLVAATVAAAAALTAALWALSGRLPESGWTTHAVSHLAVGIPAALLAAAALWWWPPPRQTPAARAARTLVVAGLAVLGAAQLLEALSARLEYPDAGWLHTVTGMVSVLALPVAAVGALLALLAPLAAGRRLPRWGAIGLGVLVALVLALLLFTLVLGAVDL